MILALENVFSGYGDSEVLHGVSLQVEKGELVAILGPNGAGKTTLLKTIMGVLKASRGSILFDSEEITRISPDKILERGIAYVPQGRSIYPMMSVKDNILAGAYLLNDRKLIDDRLHHVFDLFPRLLERNDADAGVLSGGERQILAIGRSLMLAPKVLMLDEPSLGLDPRFQSIVYQKIKELNELGTTLVLVEQNIKRALDVADRGYVLETGNVRLQGTSEELMKEGRVLKTYLGGGSS